MSEDDDRPEEHIQKMLAIASHDLRAPLSVIVSGLDLLEISREDPRLASAEKSALVAMRRNAELMARMLDRLDELVSEDSGVRVNCDLAEIVSDTVAGIEIGRSGRITLDLRPANGYFDRDAIMRLVNNLVINALAHGDAHDDVIVAVSPDDECAVLEVVNGGEVAPQVRSRLFEPFVSTRRSGLGLGLHIVQRIATAHGGQVVMDSSDGKTVFRVVLPTDHR